MLRLLNLRLSNSPRIARDNSKQQTKQSIFAAYRLSKNNGPGPAKGGAFDENIFDHVNLANFVIFGPGSL
ncbi:MAG TPA: hypothetical protein VEC06_19630 [Paucimonas sp.]|nr:hypothetical protein [Paucimonas sp.]